MDDRKLFNPSFQAANVLYKNPQTLITIQQLKILKMQLKMQFMQLKTRFRFNVGKFRRV